MEPRVYVTRSKFPSSFEAYEVLKYYISHIVHINFIRSKIIYV
jgi:hypothetical protein